MSEKADYATLRSKVVKGRRRLDRVENVVLAGMPDVNGCFDGVEFWLEMKSPTEPKRKSTPLFGSNHRVSQEQKNWFLRQLQAGGNAYFYVCTDKRYLLLPGGLADRINEMTVEQLVEKALWHWPKPNRSRMAWELLATLVSKRNPMHTS
jgi:hypothetical protein